MLVGMCSVFDRSLGTGDEGEPEIGMKGTNGLHCMIGKAGSLTAERDGLSLSECL